MTLLTSTPDGFTLIGWKGFIRAALVAWLLPAILGFALMAAQWLAGSTEWGNGWLMLWAFSLLLAMSPALSWFGLLVAAPAIAVLMDRGWFGWIPAVALGIVIGAVLGWLMGEMLAISFGAALLTLFRAALGYLSPQAVRA